MSWSVCKPDGSVLVGPFPSSGEAMDAAINQLFPTAKLRRRGVRRQMWIISKEQGYFLRETKEPPR